MLKTVLFQLHWFLGITAGTVLAVMGLSGATLSFEDELLQALNPPLAKIAQHHAQGMASLPLTELVARLRAGRHQPLQSLRVDATGHRLSVARFEGGRRSQQYFDPYSGQTLAHIRGEAFFEWVEDLHRRLVAGDTGKAITGACVIGLLFFCLSGLYLRWPRQWHSLRTWLAVEWRRGGRSFLWSLHSVVGTWVLVVYLMIALTGLWWSYDWYRSGMTRLLGGTSERAQANDDRPLGALDLAQLQRGLYAAVPGVRAGYLDLRLPNKPGLPVTARVQIGDTPAHDRAYDSLQLDPGTGATLQYQAYADMPLGRKLMASVLALHSGSFFGLPGRLVVTASALGMCLFFITGWMLYLDRRRKKRQARASRLGLSPGSIHGQHQDAPWLVSFASQSGFAEQLAWRTAGQLQAAGLPVQVEPLSRVDSALLARTRNALFVLSTFGDGQAPDSARAFERRLLDKVQALPDLGYAMLALGDRQYARFCGFSRRVDAWLHAQGARPLFPAVEVDRVDPASLADWQQQLSGITGLQVQTPLAEQAPWHDWTLRDRTLLNPGSAGGAIWHVALQPPAGVSWKAGDILEIAPRNSDARVADALANAGLAADAPVQVGGQATTLAHALATRTLPATPTDPRSPADAQSWLEALAPLPHREYSIASITDDGAAELVVRLTVAADGEHGLGSGWLCVHAAPGATVRTRVRRNAGFHRRDDGAPMILIGNGTGIAGLRSLLREAEVAGHRGHWMLYGERSARHDQLFAAQLRQWRQQGHLARIDLAFSRDQAERIYVQHLLAQAAPELERWVGAGASLYVCGSLQGMAEEVDRTLRTMLGEEAVEQLLAAGRYRRDVY